MIGASAVTSMSERDTSSPMRASLASMPSTQRAVKEFMASASSRTDCSTACSSDLFGFSIWLAGAGVKPGYVHGATDEFGHQAAENVVNHYDYHATLLHLFGLDPKELSFVRNGLPQHLVENPEARVVTELLA